MYIDESGDTMKLENKGKKHLVLTGCVIHEQDKLEIEKELREIKYKYFSDRDLEIKSTYLRYANPDIKTHSPLKLGSRKKYDALETDMTKFLKKIPVTLISAVIKKAEYWEQYPDQDPYQIAYVFLLERFQHFLQSKNEKGLCIVDPRVGQVNKSFINSDLDDIHDSLRWIKNSFWNHCPDIIERVLFSNSEKTIGIQLADLYSYPTYHIFEYGKPKYWRFSETVLNKLYHPDGKKIKGWGVKIFP